MRPGIAALAGRCRQGRKAGLAIAIAGAAAPPGPGVPLTSAEPEHVPAGDGEAAAGEARQPVAMADLYAAEAPRLWRFFRRRTACPDEASDLVQEAFSRVLAQAPRSGFRNAGGYLTRVAQNLLRDRAKIARRRSADLHEPADEGDLAGDVGGIGERFAGQRRLRQHGEAGDTRRRERRSELGWLRLQEGHADDVATLEPIYLGQPVKPKV